MVYMGAAAHQRQINAATLMCNHMLWHSLLLGLLPKVVIVLPAVHVRFLVFVRASRPIRIWTIPPN